MTNPLAAKPLVATVRRTLAATPDDVFAAWTDADSLRQWFHPAEGVAVKAVEVDARPGGRYRIVMAHDGGEFEYGGEYLEVIPGRRLKFTWIGPATKGATTVVTIDLTPAAGGTDFVLSHEKLPSEDEVKSYAGGWGRILGLLDTHLAAG